MIYTLSPDAMVDIEEVAASRLPENGGGVGGGYNRQNKSEAFRNLEGVLGEYALACYLNARIDRVSRPGGDGGVDLEVYLSGVPTTIGVRYTSYPDGRLFQDKPPTCDLLALVTATGQECEFYATPHGVIPMSVELRGWIWTEEFLRCAKEVNLHNHPGQCVQQRELYDISSLKAKV